MRVAIFGELIKRYNFNQIELNIDMSGMFFDELHHDPLSSLSN
jgi:hypothetical protein